VKTGRLSGFATVNRLTLWVSFSLTVLAAAAVTVSGQRQVFSPPSGRVENVRFEQGDGGVIHIYYDLQSADTKALFSVALEVSSDGGKTYAVKPQSLSGDVGPNVKSGSGKKIVWEAGKDVESVGVGAFAFNVVAVAGHATPSGAATQPNGDHAATSTAATPPKGKSSAMKWMLPVAGGAAVAGILAAKGGTDPPPNCPGPPGCTPVGDPVAKIDSLPSSPVPFILQTINLNGGSSASPNGAISTWSWTFGDNAAGLGAATSHAYSDGGTYTIQLTVTDVANRTATATMSVTVESMGGAWTNTVSGNPPALRTLTFKGTGPVFTSASASYQNTTLDGNSPKPLNATVHSNRTITLATEGQNSNFTMTGAVIDAAARTFTGKVVGSSADGLTLTFTRQ